MSFHVTYKGLRQYVGSLFYAMNYMEKTWGSLSKAYEIGVKLIRVPEPGR